MKPAKTHPIMASRHTLGAASFASGVGNRPIQPAGPFRMVAFLRRAMDRVAAALEFYARDILSHAVPNDGFEPESDVLRSAHWNRIYLVRGTKF